MIYRKLGKTGQEVSVIGLGCEHLDYKSYDIIKEVIDTAFESGVNILDVFMPGREVRENIAKALGNRRKEVFIQGHIGSTEINHLYNVSRDLSTAKRYFEDMLRLFGGYIDFGMIFLIDSQEDYQAIFENEFINYINYLKRQGDIRYVGFSTHKTEIAINTVRSGVVDTMMFGINPAFDMLSSKRYVFDYLRKGIDGQLLRDIDPKRAELYKLCEQKQVGITAMKTYCGGKLLSKEFTPFVKPLTPAQCIHYALSQSTVASCLVGCISKEQVKQAMDYLTATDDEKDCTIIFSSTHNYLTGTCVYCNHCQPCPSEIDIATIHRYLDVARLNKDNIPYFVRSQYQNLTHRGSECVSCGNCEKRCPFGVSVIANMAEAADLMG